MSRPLHFTIGTGPGHDSSIGQLSLETDLLLVKAALLYADRVRLCSIGSSLTLSLLALGDATSDEKLAWLESLFASLSLSNPEEAAPGLQMVSVYRQLRQKRSLRRLSKAELGMMFQIQNALGGMWENYRQAMGDFARKAGADGVIDALESGLLDLHQFGTSKIERMGGLSPEDEARRSEEFFDDLTLEFLDLIAEAVADGSTHPLFDDMAGNLVRAGVEAGVVTPSESGVARGRHSGLASDLLQRLPLFEKATVREILDIRRELENPLVRFRGAVVGFSEAIRWAAWDPDFPSDADMVFRKEVEPAVLDIDEAVRSNSELAELALRVFRPGDVATGLGVMLGSLAALPDVAALALGSGTTAAMTGHKAYKEWREDRAKIESNRMYFYHRAGERLRDA